MALIACRECGKEISSSAPACPNCGSTKHKIKVWPWLLGAPLIAFVLMLIYGASVPEYERQAGEVRRVCEKMFPLQTTECRANYDRALAEGRAKSTPPTTAQAAPIYVQSAVELEKLKADDAALFIKQSADCTQNLSEKVSSYKKFMSKRDYWPAVLALQVCAKILDDKRLSTMVADAELKHLKREIREVRNPSFERLRFIKMLIRDYPDQGEEFKGLLEQLESEQVR